MLDEVVAASEGGCDHWSLGVRRGADVGDEAVDVEERHHLPAMRMMREAMRVMREHTRVMRETMVDVAALR